MINKAGKILAVIYHPIFYIWYLTLVIYLKPIIESNSTFLVDTELLAFNGLVFLFTVLIPVLSVYFLTHDLNLSDRKKRSLPIGITITSYIVCFFALKELFKGDDEIMPIFVIFLAVTIIGLGSLWLINLFYKISMHGMGIGVITPILIMGIFNDKSLSHVIVFCTLLIFAILVLIQRVTSKSHTISEVVSGFVLGSATVFTIAKLI